MRVETEHFDNDDGNLKSNEDLEARSGEAGDPQRYSGTSLLGRCTDFLRYILSSGPSGVLGCLHVSPRKRAHKPHLRQQRERLGPSTC